MKNKILATNETPSLRQLKNMVDTLIKVISDESYFKIREELIQYIYEATSQMLSNPDVSQKMQALMSPVVERVEQNIYTGPDDKISKYLNSTVFYEDIFNTMQTGIGVIDIQGIVRKVNESAARMLQRPIEEIEGKHVSKLMKTKDFFKLVWQVYYRQMVLKDMGAYIANWTNTDGETFGTKNTPTFLKYGLSYSVVSHVEGEITPVERKQLEEMKAQTSLQEDNFKLQESIARIQQIINQKPQNYFEDVFRLLNKIGETQKLSSIHLITFKESKQIVLEHNWRLNQSGALINKEVIPDDKSIDILKVLLQNNLVPLSISHQLDPQQILLQKIPKINRNLNKLIVPIHREGELKGVIILSTKSTASFNNTQKQYFHYLGNLLGLLNFEDIK